MPAIPSTDCFRYRDRTGYFIKQYSIDRLTPIRDKSTGHHEHDVIPNTANLITFINKLVYYPFVSTPFLRVLRCKQEKELTEVARVRYSLRPPDQALISRYEVFYFETSESVRIYIEVADSFVVF